MSAEPIKAQRATQAGSSGEAVAVGLGVGGVHNKDDLSWLDLWALNPETRANLKAYRRNAACSHAQQRSEGAGDGSKEITTPEKLRKLQRTLYRKAKAEPGYRFWSLYGEVARGDLLEHALRLVARNGGAPGTDGQTIADINTREETRQQWLRELQRGLQTKTYRPSPV